MRARDRPITKLPPGTLQAWDRVVNERPLPNADTNRAVLLGGAGGRPATREELIEFVRANNARVARERTAR